MPVPSWISTRGASDRDALDAQLTAGGKQAEVLAAEGEYLQVPTGMDGTPADQNALAVDSSAKPSDRPTSCDDWGVTRQTTSTVATRIDVYDSPGGRGWGYTQYAEDNGTLWVRQVWVENPDGSPDIDWTEGP